ncbi:PREDICTED: zinc finger protein ZAT4-like [Ipomoea nil]|uniref:zinc finger protein ZAT4-like n=1 Tax=Ipomoea nil TaxID=35883 RepID=UPI000901187B|nr:PREDICTED: zinc finger protein ZAT4-like [Ipomoea nil]
MRSHVWNPYMQRTAAAAAAGDDSETEAVSSVSDYSPEEDGAYCLMMLSRDKWADEESSQPAGSGEVKTTANGKKKYRCESCRKVFRSYQALGGHRASHKKIIKRCDDDENVLVGENNGDVEEKLHECPFCYRVFSSGQALGGHKRSHFTAASASTCLLSPSTK